MISESPRTHVRKNRLSQLLFIIALIGLLVGIPGYILSARNYASHYAVLARNEQALTITTARNEAITWGLELSDGIPGYWASSQGLHLNFKEIDEPILIVAPKAQTWGDKIQTTNSESDESLIVTGKIIIPPSVDGPEQRTLSGTISGTITYPSGGILFENKSLTVDIPVSIQLIAQNDMLLSGGWALFALFIGLTILCGVLLIILAVFALVRALRTPRIHSNKPGIKYWLGGITGGFFAAIVFTGVAGGALMAFSTNGEATFAPSDTTLLGFLITGIIGLSIWLAIISSTVSDKRQASNTSH